MICVIVIAALVLFWLLCGYQRYAAYYNQALILLYLERKNLPYPTPADFEKSAQELSQQRRKDIGIFMFYDRFPFKHIPAKYLSWLKF